MKKNWQEEFKIKFGNGEITNETASGHLGDMIDFISQQIEKAKRKERKRILKIFEGVEMPKIEIARINKEINNPSN